MSIEFTKMPSKNGEEPTALLRALFYEYLAEMNRRGAVELLETVGTNKMPVLLVVIPNARVEGDKIVEVLPVGENVGTVGTPPEIANEPETK